MYKQSIKYLFMGVLILLMLLPSGAEATSPKKVEKKIALVIGNAAYEESPPLQNSLHDAQDMTAKLKQLGFSVILRTDVTRKSFHQSLDDFKARLEGADVGLFFFAGHGLRADGYDYLLPTDAHITSTGDIRYAGIDLSQLQASMDDTQVPLRLLFLDSSRCTPWRSRGITEVQQTSFNTNISAGTFIAYATAPGQVAADGTKRNGLFTEHLLQHMDTPNQDIQSMMRAVRKDVAINSDGNQVPWECSSLINEFCFNSTRQTN